MDKVGLGITGGALTTVYAVLGQLITWNIIPSIWWVRLIVTLVGPIGFMFLGLASTGEKLGERGLAFSSIFLTGYFVIAVFMPNITMQTELPNTALGGIQMFLIVAFYWFGPLFGGLPLGIYLRKETVHQEG